MERMAKTLKERGFPIIDVHGHHGSLRELRDGSSGKFPPIKKFSLALEEYFRHRKLTEKELLSTWQSEDERVELLKKYGVHAVPCAWVAQTSQGELGHNNDYIYDLTKRNPDVFLGFWGSVDPWMGNLALEEAERCLKDLKAIGLKFQQPVQAFHVNDHRFFPLWDLIAGYGGFVQFHCGYTGVGTGLPGGGGIRVLKYSNPVDVDDLAAEFPKLRIILMHVGDPFTEAAELVCMHKGNVYRETSGILPRYMPQIMVHHLNTRLRTKYFFGTEYPYFRLADDILDGWEKDIKFREGIQELFFYKNALNILGDRFENAGADLSPWKGLV